MFFLAHELKKTMAEMEDIPVYEVFEWIAYFKLKNKEEEKQMKRGRR